MWRVFLYLEGSSNLRNKNPVGSSNPNWPTLTLWVGRTVGSHGAKVKHAKVRVPTPRNMVCLEIKLPLAWFLLTLRIERTQGGTSFTSVYKYPFMGYCPLSHLWIPTVNQWSFPKCRILSVCIYIYIYIYTHTHRLTHTMNYYCYYDDDY